MGGVARGPVAFVFGGGGVLGAAEVGMVRALLEADITPDLIVGTSVGAINGAVLALDPAGAPERLTAMWTSPEAREVFGSSVVRQLGRLVGTGTHGHSPAPLRRLLRRGLGEATFDDLAIEFHCCAASIERAAEHWFTEGSVVDAVLASSAVPGLLPPVPLGGEHYVDGGIVNSIPVGRAVEHGARTVFVLQVGRIERSLQPPRRPWEVAMVAFEIARRHRFARDLEALSADVEVHVLPTGLAPDGGAWRGELSPLAYRDSAGARRRIERAYTASRTYLAEQAKPHVGGDS
jgi:NTE family protein